MNKCILSCIFCLFISNGLFAQRNDKLAKKQIELAMKFQESSWNMGNINGFMQSYWRSDSLLFIGGKGPTYGWTKTFTNYLETYPSKTEMGILKFDILQLRILSEKYAMVIGKWNLRRKDDEVGGNFSLLWEKIEDQWKIVVDHTSSE